MAEKRKQVSFRATEEQERMLDELVVITQQTRNDVLTGLIINEYDRINGNPMAKQIIAEFNRLGEQLKKMTEGETISQGEEGTAPR